MVKVMSSVRKMTFSLSPETVMNITAISQRLGVSRSGLVDQLLSGACTDMARVLDTMPTPPENGTETDRIRLRGESVKVLQARVDELRGKIDDL